MLHSLKPNKSKIFATLIIMLASLLGGISLRLSLYDIVPGGENYSDSMEQIVMQMIEDHVWQFWGIFLLEFAIQFLAIYLGICFIFQKWGAKK